MKRLMIPSILFLSYTVAMCAQDKPQLQLIPPEKLLEFPQVHPYVQGVPRILDLRKTVPMPPSSLELTFKVDQSEVCSVPLLEAHADALDPGIAFKPEGIAVAIPQAHVPAPACQKK